MFIIKKLTLHQKIIRKVPDISDYASGKIQVSDFKRIDIEDLLGRVAIKTDPFLLKSCIENKAVMVTGAGGSIGSELCCQIAKLGPRKLIIFERNEFNLYKIEQLLDNTSMTVEFILGDLCDFEKVKNVFEEFSPEIVFHAAAYKHVPILEKNPREAIRNNTLGTKIIADAASKYNCERLMLISTDKAVNPTNVSFPPSIFNPQILISKLSYIPGFIVVI